MKKTLKINEETHKMLMLIKAKYNLKTVDSTIGILIDDHDFTNEILKLTKDGNK